jgi:hypothetical protein
MAVSIKKSRTSLAKRKYITKALAKEVHREVITPSQKKISITLPENLVGKTVEVFAFELRAKDMLDPLKKKAISKKDFWDTFGTGKKSLITTEGIREKAWRRYQW